MIEIMTLVLGYVSTNCYIVSNEKKEALIVDPAASADQIIDKINQKDLKPIAILLTHAHFDHIGAIDELCQKYDIPLYVHEKEVIKLKDSTENLSMSYGIDLTVKAKPILLSEKKFKIGGFEIKYFNTPGHTIGGVCYLIEEHILTGDTLFAGSVGRTDFPGGSMKNQVSSIRMLISELSPNIKVYPGHGPSTTIGIEAKSNPFL